MSVLYFNNCWFTNIGEAFIDVGAMELLKQIFPDKKVVNFSHMNFMYSKFNNAAEEVLLNCYDMSEDFTGDYVVLAEMLATEGFADTDWITYKMLHKFVKRGAKLIFLGLGGEKYDDTECEKVKKVLDKLNPVLITTRDAATYKNYESVCNCMQAIDCAFWIKDTYYPKLDTAGEYDIVAYNRSKEPDIFGNGDWPKKIVRPFHFPYSFRENMKNMKQNFFLSDSPYDYLTLYANADCVYTDLVHATIPALQYAVPVQFKGVDGRAQVFDAVEAVYESGSFWKCNEEILEKQKKNIVSKTKSMIERM